ncbi:MAG: BACON domain-containing protein, partial [Prevotella sp.]|nr:BACON domain-containing protein [Prevotella sp.]
MRRLATIFAKNTLSVLLVFIITSCSSDGVAMGNITIAEDELYKTIGWNDVEGNITFTANDPWTATVSDVTTRAANTKLDWLTLMVSSGRSGEVKMPFVVTKNNNESYREAQITINCGGKSTVITIHQNADSDAVKIMDPSQIKDYDKYYLPAASDEGFENGAKGMLRSDNRWSWWRMKQSDHFFVFWEPGFGENPDSDSVPKALRVDVNDLLAKAEQFYKTNITKLGMATIGKGKSQLDRYKMEIYLFYQSDWLAVGSGYDNVIGALWVNPSTCQPVGPVIAHEIGHSFQYQVSADELYAGEVTIGSNGMIPVGFRYGFGKNGSGGCAFWEQCAQWQSFQDYPQEAFTQDDNIKV